MIAPAMVESPQFPQGSALLSPDSARRHVSALLGAVGVPSPEADLVAEVLTSADMRGIRSHGLARVPYFLVRLETGAIRPDPDMSFAAITATTGVVDARDGLGIVAADRAMGEAIAMARSHGCGFVAVRDSSHFGYAGFWAELARREGMIGISMSNSGGRVAPTYGVEPLLGTNPISVAIPGAGTDFVLDMATSAVAVGKVETALREDREVPTGWVTSSSRPALDDNGVLTFESALLPLGGEGVDTGGHKGYGLGLMVELLCGALTGTSFDARVAGAGGEGPAAMGHLMGALRVDGFRPPGDVARDMDATFDRIRASRSAPGHERIYIHGEPESEAMASSRAEGIVVTRPVLEGLRRWADRLGVEPLEP